MAGDGGKQLSGGERQRISLARAILKDAPVVVLDEATAFMDPENEEKMNAAIAEVIQGKTVIVIAHRLHSIVAGDKLCTAERSACWGGNSRRTVKGLPCLSEAVGGGRGQRALERFRTGKDFAMEGGFA